MNSLEELKRMGSDLGLKGSELAKFITDQQESARIERASQREAEKSEREHASRMADNAAKMAEIELEKERLSKNIPPTQPNFCYPVDVSCKPQPYKDGEDMTSFLIRFERIATLLKWEKSRWAVQLGMLLQGRALQTFASLPPETTDDYDLLKDALLTAFKCNENQYRKLFRTARISPHENYSQFLASLTRHFDFWLNSMNVENNFESLKNAMIGDQFLSSLTPDVRMFIRERKPNEPSEMARLADNFASARNSYPKLKSKPKFETDPNSQSNDKNEIKQVKCYSCGLPGHKRSTCPKKPPYSQNPSYPRDKVQRAFNDPDPDGPMVTGSVNGVRVSTILRDTGCSCVIVSEDLLPNLEVSDLPTKIIYDYLGRANSFPVTKCYLDCELFTGWVEAVVAPIKFCSILLGNIPGAKLPIMKEIDAQSDCSPFKAKTENPSTNHIRPFENPSTNHNNHIRGSPVCFQWNTDSSIPLVKPVHQAVTRAKSKESKSTLPLPKINDLEVSPAEFCSIQKSCDSLKSCWEKFSTDSETKNRAGYVSKFVIRNDLLHRECISGKTEKDKGNLQLVVPSKFKNLVLKLAHDIPVAGHFSYRKTEMKVADHFYWPGMSGDIKRYCQSCDICQKMSPKGRNKPVPLEKMPIIRTPFERIAIDIVGPLSPPTSGGHRYMLTLVDYATSFPEAIPLKNITSIDIAEALIAVFSRIGVPREVLMDRGPQFTSDLMYQVHRLIGIKPLFTTPWHPACNGRIERQHSILKSVLRKLCHDKPRDWDRYVPCALFSMREIPGDRLGFSPFELVYGRSVRGPLSILKDIWSDATLNEETKSTYQYIFDLRNRLEETADLAAKNAEISSNSYKKYYDRKTSDRTFKVGEEVLVLLPESSNKLLISWKGPFKILERRNVDYLIDFRGKPKLFHANMLKRYHRRAVSGNYSTFDEVPTDEVENVSKVQVAVLNASSNEVLPIETLDNPSDSDVNINKELPPTEASILQNLKKKYETVFSTDPGFTKTVTHSIILSNSDPFRTKVYPVPIHLRKIFDEEILKMLDLGIVTPSNSPYCNPVVMIKKPDSTYRIALDFRTLNEHTVFDSEPMPSIDQELHKFSGCKYISEIDICKAYHQVGLDENSRQFTAFASDTYGLLEYTRMPFGLVTACATYIRLMREVLKGIGGISVYFDNIYVISKTFDEHVQQLELVLKRLHLHGLTAKPSKCNFGFNEINYLGLKIKDNEISPLSNKVDSILTIEQPNSKKTLRSFIGMISFYRKFLGNMAENLAPLTDLLKKDVKEPLKFNNDAISAFNRLKAMLAQPPILKIPDIDREFCLRTDASTIGIGAVLFQYWDNTPFPVHYVSRKLLPAEKNYATVERECLAIVWAIDKLKFFLYGKKFIIETDHMPLQYLKTLKGKNDRLVRWALALQPYSYRVVYIKGSENHGADLLSRS